MTSCTLQTYDYGFDSGAGQWMTSLTMDLNRWNGGHRPPPGQCGAPSYFQPLKHQTALIWKRVPMKKSKGLSALGTKRVRFFPPSVRFGKSDEGPDSAWCIRMSIARYRALIYTERQRESESRAAGFPSVEAPVSSRNAVNGQEHLRYLTKSIGRILR